MQCEIPYPIPAAILHQNQENHKLKKGWPLIVSSTVLVAKITNYVKTHFVAYCCFSNLLDNSGAAQLMNVSNLKHEMRCWRIKISAINAKKVQYKILF